MKRIARVHLLPSTSSTKCERSYRSKVPAIQDVDLGMVTMSAPVEETPDSSVPPADGTGEVSELAEVSSVIAAAQYLSEKVGDAELVERISTAVAADDVLKATNALANAFILALDTPVDADNSLSLEGCMQELLLWVKRECAMDDALVEKIARDLCKGVSRGDLRLKCMALLYNAVSEDAGEKRFRLLNATIGLAAAAKLVPKIQETVLPNVDRFLKQWQATPEQKRTMYKTCYEALKSANEIEPAFGFNVKMLELYNGADAGEAADVEEAAVDAIVQAVCLPKLYRFDTLLELDVITAFAHASGEKALFHKLITIFVQDDLSAFTAFYDENADFLAKYGIDKEIAVDKMRLLTFASLGIESQDLSYSAIARALQIPEDMVEEWVIRAIGSGLVDAKINQLKSSVAIYRSTQRMFTREEWQPLSERINIWKENIQDLLVALRETRRTSTLAAMEAFSG